MKRYPSINHLPDSLLTKGDRTVSLEQSTICQYKARDIQDVIIVTEKLDGTNVRVVKTGSQIQTILRSGNPAQSSKHITHQLFNDWVWKNYDRFEFLKDNQSIVGEWLAYAHGTLYNLPHEPFVVFDLMEGNKRITYKELINVVCGKFITARLLHFGQPVTTDWIMDRIDLDKSFHGAQDPIEGAVWRVERKGEVDFLAKYVRPDYIPGKYLDDNCWLWSPEKF
jgi:hypothetical protein